MSKMYRALDAMRKSKEEDGDHAFAPQDQVQRDAQPATAENANDKTHKLRPGANLVMVVQPNSQISESFRFLRSKIMRPHTGESPKTILVTSALQGEGKSFVSSNLAVAISQSLEEYALLIDTDIRNPAVHKNFGIESSDKGLSAYLSGNALLEEVLHKSDIGKLTILPAGNSSEIPVELLSSEKMRLLIQEVRSRYSDRYVIIDSPPLELAPETLVIANEVDAVLVVVRYGQTPRSYVRSALGKIQRGKLLGMVFNCYDEPLKLYNKRSHYYARTE